MEKKMKNAVRKAAIPVRLSAGKAMDYANTGLEVCHCGYP
jgi:hypothetical protein